MCNKNQQPAASKVTYRLFNNDTAAS